MSILKKEIIIIGAGLSGIGCARRLADNNKDFLIISENIGGRVETSPDGEVNYGAYYVTKDCKLIWPYLRIIKKMQFKDYHFHDGPEHYHLISPQVAPHLPALRRLRADLKVFRRQFQYLREHSIEHSRRELIEHDPILNKYYHQKAGDYIKARRLEKLVDRYLAPVLWASFFEDPRSVPTFIFLQCMLPLIVPSYSFKLLHAPLTKGFSEKIEIGRVTHVVASTGSHRSTGWLVKTNRGRHYQCKKLVIATPATELSNLVNVEQAIKKATPVTFFHINGEPKPRYDYPGFQFFPLEQKDAISREEDGSFLYFYRGKNQINKYFKSYEVITKKTWRPALILKGDSFQNLKPRPNLFLANDHDVASTEDAFINGQYTAKLVMQ